MIQSAIRRPASALALTLLLALPAVAQNVTGTDPCPKGTVCVAGSKTAVTTTKPATPAPSTSSSTSSDSPSAMQMLMSLLGLS